MCFKGLFLSCKYLPFVLLALLYGRATFAQGISWQSVPLKFDRQLKGFAIDSTDSTLLVYGNFDTIGSDTTGGIIRVSKNLANYSKMTNPHRLGAVNNAIMWNGELYASSASPQGVYRWRNNGWQHLDSNPILTFYPYQGKLLMGGIFQPGKDKIGKLSQCLVAYDGTTFSKVHDFDTLIEGGGSVAAIREYKGMLYVAGSFSNFTKDWRIKEIARFNGQNWEPVGNGIQGGGLDFVQDMLVWQDTLIVCGYFKQSIGAPGNSIAMWDGQNWHSMKQGLTQSIGATGLCSRGKRLYVTGAFTVANGSPAYRVATYQEGKWCGNNVSFNNLSNAIIDYYGIILVGGGFTDIGGMPVSYIAKLSGEGNCHPSSLAHTSAVHSSPLLVYPNPAYTKVHLQFTIAQSSSLKFTVHDAKGMLIKTATSRAAAGSSTWALPIQDLAPGTYFITLSTDNHVLQGSFSKL